MEYVGVYIVIVLIFFICVGIAFIVKGKPTKEQRIAKEELEKYSDEYAPFRSSNIIGSNIKSIGQVVFILSFILSFLYWLLPIYIKYFSYGRSTKGFLTYIFDKSFLQNNLMGIFYIIIAVCIGFILSNLIKAKGQELIDKGAIAKELHDISKKMSFNVAVSKEIKENKSENKSENIKQDMNNIEEVVLDDKDVLNSENII